MGRAFGRRIPARRRGPQRPERPKSHPTPYGGIPGAMRAWGVHFGYPVGRWSFPMNEWVIVAIVAIVVIFGATKLSEIARNLGRSSSEFKKGLKEGGAEVAAADAEGKRQV